MQILLGNAQCPKLLNMSVITTSGTAWQVYKGRLRNGGLKVAVKVQRPGVREAIALDVFILRFIAKQARERFSVSPPSLL